MTLKLVRYNVGTFLEVPLQIEITSSSTDNELPSAKAVKDLFGA